MEKGTFIYKQGDVVMHPLYGKVVILDTCRLPIESGYSMSNDFKDYNCYVVRTRQDGNRVRVFEFELHPRKTDLDCLESQRCSANMECCSKYLGNNKTKGRSNKF